MATTSLFVTGASSGIGAAFVDRNPEGVNEPHTFSRRSASGRWRHADLGDPTHWGTVRSAVEQALDEERPEHAIFFHCSADSGAIGLVVDLDAESYASSVILNAAAGPALGQAFLRACDRRAIRATLVLTGSPAASKNLPGMAQYCAAKNCLQHWASVVAMEQSAESGHRIISVVPYAVLTDPVKSAMAQDPAKVPLAGYFRQVEAAGEFASPQTCADQIWAAILSEPNGAIVPVGAVVIAQREGAAADVS
jgi:NAD(P)-dependent dehydrogenase (short-subunit alcohol dehydrogenase family)